MLQAGMGKVDGRYLRSTLETVRWGALPGPDSVPAATVESGAIVTVDTISHEGILEDQGRDPVAYFGRHGIARGQGPQGRARARASSRDHDGPCVVNGPIAVRGAEPGDILRVDVLGLVPRVPYGVVSNRHAGGGAHARLDSSRRSAGPTTASAPTCRSRASCAPSSRSTRTWGSWASRATS